MNQLKEIYEMLYSLYGPQGWWPLLELSNDRHINITKSGSLKGYHPGDYSYPRTEAQKLEICIGAVLTQNTSWLQAEKALKALKKNNLINAESLIKADPVKTKELIRPAGYFNQKYERLILLAKWLKSHQGTPERDALLSIKGVGPETADSILLYAFRVPSFVVDAYTRRILLGLGLITEKSTYDEIKSLLESSLKKDYKTYQECHALLVEHAKRHYKRGDSIENCPLFQKFAQRR